ncbi:MAG: hypothetical protein NZ866_02280 [Patescibacteria group bacterium]|nr:hypothetical protein [Patescibacteria group bacterium]
MDEDYSLEEKLEKELYGQEKSERLGRIKKIWGRRIKKESPAEEWQESIGNFSLVGFFNLNLKKFFLISLFLFLLSISIFIFVFYYRSIYLKGINIEITGQLEVNTFQPYEYSIRVSNNSNTEIKDTKLIIKLDEGVYFFDDLEENKQTYNLGNIKANESRELKIKVFFAQSSNKNFSLNTELYYLSPKRNQSFSIDKNLIVSVKKDPITLQIFSPNQIFVNEPFLISLKFTNISDNIYDLILSFEASQDFESLMLDPNPVENYYWEFKNFQPNKSDEINITGKFVRYLNKPVVYFQPKIFFKNREFPLRGYNITLNLIEHPIRLEILSQPLEPLINLNENITYEVMWENKSKISLENVQVKVYLNGQFDFNSINTDGYFSPMENSIIWNVRNKPQLLSVQPGNKDSVRFSIKSVKNYPSGEKNLNLVIRAVFETETIPPEVQILTKKLTVETQQTKIIPGKFEMIVKVDYDNQFNNSGPFPLVNGKQTTLSAYFDFCSWGEDFQNIIIKGKLPLGVNLTGNFGLNFDVNNFQFNPETGEFNYRIDELSAGYCDIYPPYRIAFQISVTPPIYGNIRDFVVFPPFSVSTQGKFSQKVFELETNKIDILKIHSKRN